MYRIFVLNPFVHSYVSVCVLSFQKAYFLQCLLSVLYFDYSLLGFVFEKLGQKGVRHYNVSAFFAAVLVLLVLFNRNKRGIYSVVVIRSSLPSFFGGNEDFFDI